MIMSSISYNELKAEGLGYLANKEGRGIICYSSIAISDEGIPLFLLYQQTWVRPLKELGKAKRREQIVFDKRKAIIGIKG
jgi:hypothetical protein